MLKQFCIVVAAVTLAAFALSRAHAGTSVQECQGQLAPNQPLTISCFNMAYGASVALNEMNITCPGNITYGQAYNMFDKWARGNPELWHIEYVSVYIRYMVMTWPCESTPSTTLKRK